jgi:hypothetical protein
MGGIIVPGGLIGQNTIRSGKQQKAGSKSFQGNLFLISPNVKDSSPRAPRRWSGPVPERWRAGHAG